MILAISAGIYYLLGRWASGRLYDKGYPVWAGWVIALSGLIPTLILVSVLPSKRAELERSMMLTAEMELARQNAGVSRAGYANQAPPVWAPNTSHAPPAGGRQPAASGSAQPVYPQPAYFQPTHQQAPVGPGFVSPQWTPSASQAKVPAGTRQCDACEFFIAPGCRTCPNCGLPVG